MSETSVSQSWGLFEEAAPIQETNSNTDQIQKAQEALDHIKKISNNVDVTENQFLSQYILCESSGQIYALPITEIKEIISSRTLNPLPIHKKGIAGYLPVRGQVLPVIDLDRTLKKDLEEIANMKRACIVICELDDYSFGLAVDTVTRVIALSSNERKKIPQVGRHLFEEHKKLHLATEYAEIDGKSILFIDLREILGAAMKYN